jgi:hypothetical protein
MLARTRVVFSLAVSLAAAAGADEMDIPGIEGMLVPPGLTAEGRRSSPPAWDGAPAAAASPSTGGPMMRLAWSDPSGVASALARGAQEEAARLFERAGIDTAWVPPGPILAADEVRVIVLNRPGAGRGGNVVLGSTPTGVERSQHVWVHMPSVMTAVGLGGREIAVLPGIERQRLAVALGRVVAHELVHAVAPSVPHGPGLMAATLTARELTRPGLAVPDKVVSALFAALAPVEGPAVARVRR